MDVEHGRELLETMFRSQDKDNLHEHEIANNDYAARYSGKRDILKEAKIERPICLLYAIQNHCIGKIHQNPRAVGDAELYVQPGQELTRYAFMMIQRPPSTFTDIFDWPAYSTVNKIAFNRYFADHSSPFQNNRIN